MSQMTSRERVLAAMRYEEVDHVPIMQGFWTLPPEEEQFVFASKEEEIAWLKGHGFEPQTNLPIPYEGDRAALVNPEIKQRLWEEDDPNEPYPILCSEWTSPKGTLSAKLRKTEDYCFDTIHFFCDYNTCRYTKPMFETGEDLMTFIAMDPYNVNTLEFDEAAWREECKAVKAAADTEQIVVGANGGTALDYLIWSSTAEQAILLAVEYPDEVTALLNYLNDFSMKRVSLCLEMGADFVTRRGWYDSADFWSPDMFAQFSAPQIQREVDLVHEAGAVSSYIMCTGITPMIPELAKLTFDCLSHPEPVCTGQSLKEIADGLRPGKAFWTGLSAPIHIGRGSTDDVRQAVREAFDIFGHRGFILQAVPSIRKHWPWENVEAMIDEHHKLTS